MYRWSLFFSLLFFLLLGCEQPVTPAKQLPNTDSATSLPASGNLLLQQPTTAQLFELPNEALPQWQRASAEKPVLVLYSADPLLLPLQPELRPQAEQLTLTGTISEIRQHGSLNTAKPIILPPQTLSAALEAGLFSQIYWMFPAKAGIEKLQLEKFRAQLLQGKILSKTEAAGLTLKNGVFSTEMRGIPFQAVHPRAPVDVPEPLILHIDLGYFQGLYDNEANTPLHTLLRDTLESLQKRNWAPLHTTLSYSNIEGAVALDARFLLTKLAEIIKNPGLMNNDRQSDRTKDSDLSEQLLKVDANSAADFYDQFQMHFSNQQLETALAALREAVQRDPGYGAAYLQLAQTAAQAGQLHKSLEFLGNAEKLFPEYPLFSLQQVSLLVASKQFAAAEKPLSRLPQQWSEQYHPQIPALIAQLRRQIIDGKSE